MLSGRIGVAPGGVEGGDIDVTPILAVASAMAAATGTFVSNKQPAGTQPCFDVSGSTRPEPAGSRCTTHQPRARDKMMKVSPLIKFQTTHILHDYKSSALTPQHQTRRPVPPCMDK